VRNVSSSGNEHGEKNAANPVPAASTIIPAATFLSDPTNATNPTYPAAPTTTTPIAVAVKRARDLRRAVTSSIDRHHHLRVITPRYGFNPLEGQGLARGGWRVSKGEWVSTRSAVGPYLHSCL